MDSIYDEYGREVSINDDDYEHYKHMHARSTNPLDDDYNKYDNE